MSLPFLNGLPKKVKDVYDILAAVTFSNLDTTVSSRASSSEVAKAATWTSGLASTISTNLDDQISDVISDVAQVVEAPATLSTDGPLPLSSTAWGQLTSSNNPLTSFIRDAYSGGSYDTALDETGRGYLNGLIYTYRNSSGSTAYNYGARVTIDGSTGNVFNNVSYSLPANGYRILCFCGLGGFMLSSSGDILQFIAGLPFRYTSSLKIECYSASANVVVRTFYSYLETS